MAAIIVKRLDDALADGDPIRAIIRETAVNQDGKTTTITAPNQTAQEELIRSCYHRAGLDPLATTYIEAHGTGTPVGDPLEMAAIEAVLCSGRSTENSIFVGSIKTNIGHTEASSGLASVIKVVLALERGLIPPNIHFNQPNIKLGLRDRKINVGATPTLSR